MTPTTRIDGLRTGTLALAICLAAASTQACDALAAYLPPLDFCGDAAQPKDLVKLAEGPAVFVDAIRTVTAEVATQSKRLGDGLQGGIDVAQQVLPALGAYQWEGSGSYSREAATDRSFKLRFYYGDGVAGKTADQPIEADLSRLDSYVKAPNFTNLLDPSSSQGPLFPLIQSLASGLSTGSLAFKDDALRFEVGSQVASNLKGYDLKLGLATQRNTASGLIKQLGDRKLGFNLADTALANVAAGFALTVEKFDLTVGLDGSTQTSGDYLFRVNNGPLKYYGAVTTTAGVPTLSLRCSATPGSEWGTVSFASGKADFKFNSQNFPISLPGLAPLKDALK